MEAVLTEIFRQKFGIYRALYKIKKSPELQSQADPIFDLSKEKDRNVADYFPFLSPSEIKRLRKAVGPKCLTMYAARKLTW
jgi:hypothetical protein